MSLHDPKLILQQMREYALVAHKIAAGTTPDALPQDLRTRLALERALSVIGEAAARLSPEFQAQHPEIPWRQIIGMRHRIVHGYDAVSDEILWKAASQDAAALARQLDELLARM